MSVHDTQVDLHAYFPLRFIDHIGAMFGWKLGRCSRCYLPAADHPTKIWTTARPRGDRRRLP